jgi:flavin reductase (DIM6/NTAB) family NADH-FMN oxidoreductase RutF
MNGSTGSDIGPELYRFLTPPVVAVTTSAAGRRNGMIANSAQRASLVPGYPRVSLYISKTNFTHHLVSGSGVFGIHLLRPEQWDLIATLGLSSGRDADKLAGLSLREGVAGCPLLTDVRAAFECRVVNSMDAGASTFFLGDVVSVYDAGPGPIMTSDYFRSKAPPDIKQRYEERLAAAQRELEPLSRTVDRGAIWAGPTTAA